ncbi:MAG: hypothetical protein ACTSUE_19475 [Promethearchaeota archaeon]
MSKLIGILESEGVLEKRKESAEGRTFNRIIYKGGRIANGGEISTEKILDPLFFRSPCFFCNNLERCGKSTIINYINCPRLDEWIYKDF